MVMDKYTCCHDCTLSWKKIVRIWAKEVLKQVYFVVAGSVGSIEIHVVSVDDVQRWLFSTAENILYPDFSQVDHS